MRRWCTGRRGRGSGNTEIEKALSQELANLKVRAASQASIIGVRRAYPTESDKLWASTRSDIPLVMEIPLKNRKGGARADMVINPSDPDFNSSQEIYERTHSRSCQGNGHAMQPKMKLLTR